MKLRIVLLDHAFENAAGLFEMGQRQVGSGQQIVDRAERAHAAGFEQRDVIGDAHHLADLVTDIDDRYRQLVVQALQVRQDIGAACQVQIRQRFVHQQQLRAGEQGARDRDPLALTAR